MTKSLFQYTRTIYCASKNTNPSWLESNIKDYKPLKDVTGYIRYGTWNHEKEAIEVLDQTCSNLVAECRAKFGPDYKYIQSGTWSSSDWDTVKASGRICDNLKADEHYSDDD